MFVQGNQLEGALMGLTTYTCEDGIARIVMDDGKVNALSPAMFAELNAAFDRAADDRAIVVLTGRSGVFSAGFDLKVLRAGGPEANAMVLIGFKLAVRMLSFAQPIVVACSGHALAMGAFLVLSADYRVGARGDHKIGANEVAIGLTMPYTAIQICRLRLQPAYLQRALLTSEVFAPDAAQTAGFLDAVVAPNELFATALEVAQRFKTLDRAAYAATKLRVRAEALQAIHGAIEADAAAVAKR